MKGKNRSDDLSDFGPSLLVVAGFVLVVFMWCVV
jgi:hypothetical protein